MGYLVMKKFNDFAFITIYLYNQYYLKKIKKIYIYSIEYKTRLLGFGYDFGYKNPTLYRTLFPLKLSLKTKVKLGVINV